jgi:hypothetical protein
MHESESHFIARRETAPFYRSKSTIYNVWFMSEPTLYFNSKLTLQGSRTACIVSLRCLNEHDDMLAQLLLPRACAAVGPVPNPGRALTHAPDLTKWQTIAQESATSPSLVGWHAINQVIARSLICNMNLAYSEGTRLNYRGMIATSGHYDMAIITLGRLYFVLSCRLARTNVAFMLYECRACSGTICILTGPHLHYG